MSKQAMAGRVTEDGRVLGFNAGDWSILVVGFLMIGLLILLA
jgi:hypothetical protein